MKLHYQRLRAPTRVHLFAFFALALLGSVDCLLVERCSYMFSTFLRRSSSHSTPRKVLLASMSSSAFSAETLSDKAKELIDRNLAREESERNSCCIAVAGGGGKALSALSSTAGASQLLLEGCVAYSRKSYLSYVRLASDTTGFFYTSMEAARLASNAALLKALQFQTSDVRRMTHCVGVGCTSSLTSSGEKSKAFIVATSADGRQLCLSIVLDDSGRTREEEDICVSNWVLRAIDFVSSGSNAVDDLHEEGEEEAVAIDAKYTSTEGIDIETTVKRVVDGAQTIAVLMPLYKSGHPVSFQSLPVPVIPNGSLIFPGSFNPPHKGHIALAEAAVQAEQERRPCSRSEKRAAYFELSLLNADKPAIDPRSVVKRLQYFLELESLPSHWGVILTMAPLFSDKVRRIQNCIETFDNSCPKMSFVIGTDTLVRLIDRKYYDNDESKMVSALQEMEGTRFVVGGRLDQKAKAKSPRFVSGGEEISQLPVTVKDMFTTISEENFRSDISSTEIRNSWSEEE
mmetsp:Transcript_44921/g.108589  ORF Transcript_44921/g.108589 Transcript_44921/m.108589 type:complete len:515 (+) Transcript_44921:23-1567(+)